MSQYTNIEIYFADDHEIVASSIANLLSSIEGVASVKTFSTGKSLFMECNSKIPSLAILDMEMPEWSGLDTLKKLRELGSFPVLILSMNDEKSVIQESMKAGANGYLNKNCTVKELQDAIETVLTGNTYLSEEIKKILVGISNKEISSFELTESLTDKEQEVLKLVCDGLSSKEIGEKLFLSSRTIETHKNSLMKKFNVQSTGRLISLAIKNKLIK
jgi:DNA-binding NarL/FixJ family response regulator